jgi:hypothetical protein
LESLSECFHLSSGHSKVPLILPNRIGSGACPVSKMMWRGQLNPYTGKFKTPNYQSTGRLEWSKQ